MLLTQGPSTREYPPLFALIALLCFHSARLDARIDSNDGLIILEDQDRSRWNAELIGQGMQFLSRSAVGSTATAYHLEAAIAAEHCMAPDFAATNWERIYDYYTALEKLKPSSVIRLNLAIVTGKKDGPQAAITLCTKLNPKSPGRKRPLNPKNIPVQKSIPKLPARIIMPQHLLKILHPRITHRQLRMRHRK